MTAAAYIVLALYHPEYGYYARAARRSGRAGDFFTSVDVGPLFGELLAVQLAEMFELLEQSQVASLESRVSVPQRSVDLVEAGAGDARLATDVLRAARAQHPAFYDSVRLHLVESS